ncbi:hypothetical protein, partial [Salmonella enterica]|uniref:hypothetical protein n=1 Tax=Salmonella enterica TaxID=28901 RepID=UPI001E57BD90
SALKIQRRHGLPALRLSHFSPGITPDAVFTEFVRLATQPDAVVVAVSETEQRRCLIATLFPADNGGIHQSVCTLTNKKKHVIIIHAF